MIGPGHGAVVDVLTDPHAIAGDFSGNRVHALGRTEGADDITDDLGMVAARSETELLLHVWYGGELPRGRMTLESAAYTRAVPEQFRAFLANSAQTATSLSWVGDLDGNGLDDLCWADWHGNDGDGLMQCLR